MVAAISTKKQSIPQEIFPDDLEPRPEEELETIYKRDREAAKKLLTSQKGCEEEIGEILNRQMGTKAYKLVGNYPNFADYVTTEFGISRPYGYQLANASHVRSHVEKRGPIDLNTIPNALAASLKKLLPYGRIDEVMELAELYYYKLEAERDNALKEWSPSKIHGMVATAIKWAVKVEAEDAAETGETVEFMRFERKRSLELKEEAELEAVQRTKSSQINKYNGQIIKVLGKGLKEGWYEIQTRDGLSSRSPQNGKSLGLAHRSELRTPKECETETFKDFQIEVDGLAELWPRLTSVYMGDTSRMYQKDFEKRSAPKESAEIRSEDLEKRLIKTETELEETKKRKISFEHESRREINRLKGLVADYEANITPTEQNISSVIDAGSELQATTIERLEEQLAIAQSTIDELNQKLNLAEIVNRSNEEEFKEMTSGKQKEEFEREKSEWLAQENRLQSELSELRQKAQEVPSLERDLEQAKATIKELSQLIDEGGQPVEQDNSFMESIEQIFVEPEPEETKTVYSVDGPEPEETKTVYSMGNLSAEMDASDKKFIDSLKPGMIIIASKNSEPISSSEWDMIDEGKEITRLDLRWRKDPVAIEKGKIVGLVGFYHCLGQTDLSTALVQIAPSMPGEVSRYQLHSTLDFKPKDGSSEEEDEENEGVIFVDKRTTDYEGIHQKMMEEEEGKKNIIPKMHQGLELVIDPVSRFNAKAGDTVHFSDKGNPENIGDPFVIECFAEDNGPGSQAPKGHVYGTYSVKRHERWYPFGQWVNLDHLCVPMEGDEKDVARLLLQAETKEDFQKIKAAYGRNASIKAWKEHLSPEEQDSCLKIICAK